MSQSPHTRHVRRLLTTLAWAGVAAGTAAAQAPVVPCVPCPPGSAPVLPLAPGQPGVPGQPGTPAQPGSPTDPAQQPVAGQPAAAPADAGAPSFSQGGSSFASASPNMMGDLFGARSLRIQFDRLARLGFGVAPPGAGATDVSVLVRNLQAASFAPPPGQGGDTIALSNAQVQSIARRLAEVGAFSQPLAAGQTQLTPAQTQTARVVLQAVVDGRSLTAAEVAALPADIRAQLPRINSVINSEVTRGLTIPGLRVVSVGGSVNGGVLTYEAGVRALQSWFEQHGV